MNTLSEAIERLWNLREALKEMRDSAGKLELEIIQEFEANEQSAYEDGRFEVRIPLKREYDVQKFLAVMGEVLSIGAFASVYSPAHTKEVEVPASVNGTKVKKLWDQGFKHDLEKTLLPPVRKLTIKPKKTETPL